MAFNSPSLSIDSVVLGDYLITMDPEEPIIEKGAVAIQEGRILKVGPEREVLREFIPQQTISGSGRLTMPGLINGHTHAAMTLFRGFADDLSLHDWLYNRIFPAEARYVTPAFIRLGTELACWEMIASGVTTFVDMYFYPEIIAEVVERCGLRAIVAMPLADLPMPGLPGQWEEQLAKMRAFIGAWRNHPRLSPAVGPHSPYTLSSQHLRAIGELANEERVPLKIHLSETEAEVEEISCKYGKRPIEYLDTLGLLAPNLIAAHVVWPSQGEIELLAHHHVGVINNFTTNLKLASGIPPLPQLLAAGVRVGLGTDGAASSNNLDIWKEMRLAALLHKVLARDPTLIPAMTALKLITSGGAAAIGLNHKVGMIASGKCADLIQLRLDSEAHQCPIYDPLSHLAYAAQQNDVVTVMVEGKLLLVDGIPKTLDPAAIKRKVTAMRQTIAFPPL